MGKPEQCSILSVQVCSYCKQDYSFFFFFFAMIIQLKKGVSFFFFLTPFPCLIFTDLIQSIKDSLNSFVQFRTGKVSIMPLLGFCGIWALCQSKLGL